MLPTSRNRNLLRTVSFILILSVLLSACQFALPGGNAGQDPAGGPLPSAPPPTPQPLAETTFEVALPSAPPAGSSLVIAILDEVTGLALNAQRYTMQPRDERNFTLKLPMPVNSVVRYRYELQGSTYALEDSSHEFAVRYRLLFVTGPSMVQDLVTSWTGMPYDGPAGRITGEVVNTDTGDPLPGILVAAGGQQSITDSRGQFALEGMVPGTHNLVAYAMDGMYETYQQGAAVGDGLETNAPLRLRPAKLVNVIFTVTVPENTVPGAPVRVAGNLLQLGNSFGDLQGGLSAVASRMPVMSMLPDGRYSLSMNLPAGADIRYKYTLGDGFWNAEHNEDSSFTLRQLVVPQDNLVIQDVVETWQAGDNAPITFQVTVPEDTPTGDRVSIQFNPFAWTEPVPMWSVGNNRWVYRLYGPLNLMEEFGYRFCRNEQCGSADDAETTGFATGGRRVSTGLSPQDIQVTVSQWAWMQADRPPLGISSQIQPRQPGFLAGIEFQPGYHPTWFEWFPAAYMNAQALSSNTIVLSPTWSVTGTSPLVFNPVGGQDAFWYDLMQAIGLARAVNFNVALFPQPQLSQPAADWWSAAPRDDPWWRSWFAAYGSFAIHHADLAARSNAQVLVLGGEWVQPALPGGKLADGSPSGVPADAGTRWENLLKEVRDHYTGTILWAVPFPGGTDDAPDFLKDLDGVYLLWHAPLGNSVPRPPLDLMQAEAGRLLDEEVEPFVSELDKPVVIAVAYTSIAGTAFACLPSSAGGCRHWSELDQPDPHTGAYTLDMQAQAEVYQAVLAAINERSWVDGFISRGYYPPAALMDASASVHGKPAADYLWYWFPRWLGLAQ